MNINVFITLGVIQFLPADGPTFGDVVFSNPDLAGTVFTGSSK